MASVKKCNEWLVPQSILTGVAVTMALMIVPAVRDSLVSVTKKVSDMVGLK